MQYNVSKIMLDYKRISKLLEAAVYRSIDSSKSTKRILTAFAESESEIPVEEFRAKMEKMNALADENILCCEQTISILDELFTVSKTDGQKSCETLGKLIQSTNV